MTDTKDPKDATDATEDNFEDVGPITIEVVEPADEEEPPKRETWGSKIAYICTLVGYAIGFGNVWRFPYRFRDNGGLAFMVPYLFMLITIGIPIFFLELALGQRIRKGIVYCWHDVNPYFGGLGITCGWLCFIVGLYYNTLLAYCVSYFFYSFWTPLPWTSCTVITSNSNNETKQRELEECGKQMDHGSTKYYWNRRTLGISQGIDDPGAYNLPLAGFHLVCWLAVYFILVKGMKSVEFTVYITATLPYVVLFMFFGYNLIVEPTHAWLGAYRVMKPDWKVLKDPNTWLQAGGQLFFSLGLGYGCLIIFASFTQAKNDCYRDAIMISLINCGTSVFAALVVLPLIGRHGYKKWMNCMQTSQKIFPKLKLWTLSDWKEKHFDVYFFTFDKVFDSSTVVKVQYGYGELKGKKAGESLYQDDKLNETVMGLTDVNVSYHNSHIRPTLKNCSIGELATASGAGTGFVFLGFTEAVLSMPGSNFWSLLFFFMLILLGIDSSFGTIEGAVNAFEDITGISRFKSTTIVCGLATVLALLLFPFGWGNFVLDLLDTWTASYTVLTVALVECIAIAWVYGLANFAYDVRLMTGSKPNMYILLSWKYFSPVIITLLLVGSIASYIKDNIAGIYYSAFRPNESFHQDSDYDGEVKIPMPRYAIAVGFLLMIFSMAWVLLQCILKKWTKFSLLRKRDSPGDFPEEKLREERNINVEKEADQFTNAEKSIMGQRSLTNLQKHRDEVVKTKSQSSLKSLTKDQK